MFKFQRIEMQKKIAIAIDGYSSCGKSTLAKALAKELGYVFIDTGAMYRAVSLYALRNKMIVEKEIDIDELVRRLSEITLYFELNKQTGLPEIVLNGENVESEIRSIEVSSFVSRIAEIREVRSKLIFEQQKMGAAGGVVMDGRDVGSVVLPNAELKLFITCDPAVRALRRFNEMIQKNPTVTLAEIQQNLTERDYIDTHRALDPLIQVDDAVLIDNTNLTPTQQLELALNLVRERQSS